MDDGQTITTSTGVILDPTWGACKDIRSYAEENGIKGAEVYSALFPGGARVYVLFINGVPNFETYTVEAMGAHIDILKLQREAAADAAMERPDPAQKVKVKRAARKQKPWNLNAQN